MMVNRKGAYAVIDFKSLDVANNELGYRICSDRTQDHAHEAIMMNMHELCDRILSSQLTEKEAKQVLHQRLVPKQDYNTRLTSLTRNSAN